MSRIIKIEGAEIYIGTDDQNIIKVPIASVNYANPQIGDEVNIFQDGETAIVARAETIVSVQPQPQGVAPA